MIRIATWNLAGRCGPAHSRFIDELDADVLLLTEVNHHLDLPGYRRHNSAADMAVRRSWAAVLSRSELRPLADPHGASAAAVVDGVTYCSSILPWRSCGSRAPWVGANTTDRTENTVTELSAALPAGDLVWGGDWNHALAGREYAGSIGGRAHIAAAVTQLGLIAATADLPHRIEGLLSIDHIALPTTWTVTSRERIDAAGLSDHDAYVVEVRK